MNKRNILLIIITLIISILISISIIYIRKPHLDYLLHPRLMLASIDTPKIILTNMKIKKYYDDSLDITFTFEYYIRGNKDIRTSTVRFIPDGKGNYAPGNGL
mgnify:CR=1 FL=1